MIEFTHVSKDFGSGEKMVRAVRDVSLTIQDGEIFGIIGFSGAGKSTLVRCINLLERPTNGTVVVDGKEMTALSPKELRLARRKIGMIFQHFNLMPSRTVFGNVAYPLQGQGLSKQAIQNKVRKLLKLVDIADKETAYPSQLSGGQKQRVAIARGQRPEGLALRRGHLRPGPPDDESHPYFIKGFEPKAEPDHCDDHPRNGRGERDLRPRSHHGARAGGGAGRGLLSLR